MPRKQTKVASFHCDACGRLGGTHTVGINEPTPVRPMPETGFHILKLGRKPSQWEHYCDVCWRFYEPAKIKFIWDWNDCVSRGLYLSEELAKGWWKYVSSTWNAKQMGVKWTEPFTGTQFDSPGNYQAIVKKALAKQWEMGEELAQVHGMIDSGQMQNLPRVQYPHPSGYVETAHFDAQLPGDSVPASEKVTVYWGVDPYKGTRYSMQQLQDEMIQEAILASPEFQQVMRFNQLMEQMKDLILHGKETDVEVVLMVCDPLDGDCVKVECPKLILHGNTIEIDFPERLKDAIDVAGDKLAEAQRQ